MCLLIRSWPSTERAPCLHLGSVAAALENTRSVTDRARACAPCRETTALQRKLEGMSGQIGGFGLAAALLSLAAMSGQFTWAEFVVAGHPWSWDVLPRYLHFIITAITIVVRCARRSARSLCKGSRHSVCRTYIFLVL